MARHEVALLGREEVAEGTMAFRFAKPANVRNLVPVRAHAA